MKSTVVCDRCKADGFWERQKAECANCGLQVKLCPECKPTYVTCGQVCQDKWRTTNKTILFELIPAGVPKKRRRKENGQARLF